MNIFFYKSAFFLILICASTHFLVAQEENVPSPIISEEILETLDEVLKDEVRRMEEEKELFLRIEEDAFRELPEAPILLPAVNANLIYSSKCFSFTAKDSESLRALMFFARKIETGFESFFVNEVRFSKPINVYSPLPEKDDEGGVVSKIQGGSAEIKVVFGKNFTSFKYCEALIDAYLSVYKKEYLNSEKPTPYWLTLAIKTSLARFFSYGISFELVDYAAKNPPDALEKVLKYAEDEDGKNFSQQENSAYWTLAAFQAASKNTKDFEDIFKKLLLGESDIKNLLPEQTKNFADNFGLWWRVLITGEIYSRYGGIKNFENSEKEVVYFCTILKTRNEESPEKIFDKEIFNRRNEIKPEINRRIMEIKIGITWLNPVYCNAAIALGRMYEAAYNGNKSDFDTARGQFLQELLTAREIAKRSSKLLAPTPAKAKLW